VEHALAALAPTEGYHAYPGGKLMAALADRVAGDDATGTARLARRISAALLVGSFRDRLGDWEVHDDRAAEDVSNVMPLGIDETVSRQRPYFETLFVTNQPAARWPALAAEVRRVRRPEDQFIYDPSSSAPSRTRSAPPPLIRRSARWCSRKAFPTGRGMTRRRCARSSIRSASRTRPTFRRCAWPAR
jgi:hypothetical protein